MQEGRHSYDVVGIGAASWDFIGAAQREPMLGAKQPLAGWFEAGGGPVATALVTLARLGLRPCLVGAVGNDNYGQRIVADLQREGVATEGVVTGQGSSQVAFALAEPESGRRTIWWHNDRAVFAHIPLDRTLITSARALHIDSHLPEVGLPAAQWMSEAGKLVMFDAERHSANSDALLPFCNVIIVSERFGREATGEAEPARTVRALYERNSQRSERVVVVTAGEQGSWCASAEGEFHTPAFSVEVVDTTGAGDVFHGGFLYGLLSGWPLREVARFASATAALKCRAYGGRAGIPRIEEVQALLQR